MSTRLTDRDLERYSRNILLNEVGTEGQQKLKDARVLVIGAGGLGCPALQYLVAAGIGTIGIVDFDIVDETNLQRQVLFGTSDVGLNKAIAAKKRLESLNPLIEIRAINEKLDQQNALELFSGYDIVLDGTDNFSSRYIISDAAILTGTPVVYGAIHRFEGQVSVFNYEDGPSYRCLFPELPEASVILNCSEQGVLGVLPGIIGSYQANEVMKIILQTGEVLSGTMMLVDIRSNKTSLMAFAKTDAVKRVLESRESFLTNDYDFSCENHHVAKSVKEITVEDVQTLLNRGERIQFVDVRETTEPKSPRELLGLRIPSGEILHSIATIEKDGHVIIYCHSGVRSEKVVKKLQDEYAFENLLSLKGGAKAWVRFVKESENNIEMELS